MAKHLILLVGKDISSIINNYLIISKKTIKSYNDKVIGSLHWHIRSFKYDFKWFPEFDKFIFKQIQAIKKRNNRINYVKFNYPNI